VPNGRIAIAGAGFSGAVLASELAKNGYEIDVFESRSHVGGNCFTERDAKTGIMVHRYGPHIFNTNKREVWDYISQFDELMPFTNRVKAHARGRVYSLPVNLLTINQFFDRTFSPQDAKVFVESLADTSIESPQSFEEQALRFFGRELYEAFFRGYTTKQWGVDPRDLPASILRRLPLRFNYDDNYYSSKYQGMPKHGYTHIIQQLLDHKEVSVFLNTPFVRSAKSGYSHVFYSGPIDLWFDYSLGRLGYRTLGFENEYHKGDYQGNPVINYCDEEVPFTRIAEHKHFSPWESFDDTIVTKEYSRLCDEKDTPYYPLRLLSDKSLLGKYVEIAKMESQVTFLGRLGTYRYLDMDLTIAEALSVASKYLAAASNGHPCPALCVDPLA
jgi:UDP-galactopyranose mutase